MDKKKICIISREEGDSFFLTLKNETVVYEGEECHTIFMNEAAYYEKGFAMTLAEKRVVEINV